MGRRLFNLFHLALDTSGNSIAGGQLEFFAGGTTTFLDTFSDAALTPGNENLNPVVADGSGRFPDIYLQDADYTIRLLDSDGTVIDTTDYDVANDENPAQAIANNALLNVVQTYTKQQGAGLATLTDQASIDWNLDDEQSAIVTLTANRTLANPTNQVAGNTYSLIVRQDAGGTNTLAYGSAYFWVGGAAPTVASGANDISILTFLSDGTNMHGVSALDLS